MKHTTEEYERFALNAIKSADQTQDNEAESKSFELRAQVYATLARAAATEALREQLVSSGDCIIRAIEYK